MTDSRHYDGREQTLIKHVFLEKYLETFAHVVGSHWDTLTYVDCFSGPWKSNTDDHKDSSFSIALKELVKARNTWKSKNQTLKIRCLFIEKDKAAFQKLSEFSKRQPSDIEVESLHGEMGKLVPEILAFVKNGGRNAFQFFFIDPTGWTGFPMNTIAPILAVKPGEVLINLMGHVHRFISSPNEDTQESFDDLFGSTDFRKRIDGLSGDAREDAVVQEYARCVRKTGSFKYSCVAIVMHPKKDRTHFHLVYATRNQKGVKVFKGAEKSAMNVQLDIRAGAVAAKIESSGQTELLGAETPYQHQYFIEQRTRYLSMAKNLIREKLFSLTRVSFDEAWEIALSIPLVWESDLKDWLKEWESKGEIELRGRKPKQRVPQYGEGILLIKIS